MRLRIISCVAFVFLLLTFVNSYAAHPLITDDAGTAGKNGVQIELAGEYSIEKENGVKEKAFETGITLTYGILDPLDIVLGVPYQYISSEAGDVTTSENGLSDISLQLKWRFLKSGIFNFALKPGISFPTGDEEKGLGTGKIGYSGYLISTIEMKSFAFHINAGYIRNNNKADEEKNILHGSLACEYSINDSFKIVANTGFETNTDKEADEHPAFILGGVIYKINDKLSADGGIKFGLNKPETDYTFLAGLTLFL